MQKTLSYGTTLAIGVLCLSAHVSAAEVATPVSPYTSVSCATQAFYGANMCDLCFEEKTILPPGAQLVGLSDMWINRSGSDQIMYKDEQSLRPELINLGGSGTKWTQNPADPMQMWGFPSEITWTASGSRQVFTIPDGKSLKFMEQLPNTSYTLESSDKKKNDIIGMVKFPLTYRDIDQATKAEGSKITHFECVAYRYDAPQIAIAPAVVAPSVTPPKTVTAPVVAKPAPEPAPKQITATKTGPELWIAGIIALMLAPMIMFLKKRRI